MTKLSGGCLCGAVKYVGDTEPMFMGNCYCTDCRKSSGTGHKSLLAVPASAIQLSGKVNDYAVTADSGATVRQHFCPNCGSPIYHTNSGMEGAMVLVASTLDDLEVFKPQMSVYASRAASWDQPAGKIPQFPKMPPMGG